eukprot:TRINITY_DN3130_c0_g1_i1.p1 TRINITY_DN3130_c0_g1~~TRINITY_DN3130_c0_g1_i1.p1  ORF type:complete len:224 (+),score=44.48 TRINITY_DN3130_c0_g1_i1:212-883(+)
MNAQGVNYDPPDNFFSNNPPQFQPVPQQASAYGNQSGMSDLGQKLRSLHHPVASFFHVFWKLGAIFTYLFAGLLYKDTSFVYAFITCVLLLAFDFWTVKNVSGRLMVGLRWWNEIKDDGSNEWIFESLEDKSRINSFEKTLFWGALFISPVLWVLFGVVGVLKINVKWLVICGIALALGFANLIGYIKCARDARSKFKKLATSYITKAVVTEGLRRAAEPSNV